MRRTTARLAAALLSGTVLALTACGSSASYSAKVLSYSATDPAHLGVTVQVTNTGSSAGTPSCLIQAQGGEDTGTTDVTTVDPLPAGQTTRFATSLVITNQGAAAVDNVTVSCT